MQNVITGTSYAQNCKFTWCLMGIRSGPSYWGGGGGRKKKIQGVGKKAREKKRKEKAFQNLQL